MWGPGNRVQHPGQTVGFRLKVQRPSLSGSAVPKASPWREETLAPQTNLAGCLSPFSGPLSPLSWTLGAESGMNSLSQATSAVAPRPLPFLLHPCSLRHPQCLVLCDPSSSSVRAAGLTANLLLIQHSRRCGVVTDMFSLVWTRACWVLSQC